MGNTSVKGHDVDDHGPTLVARHVTSYASDSDTEGKVWFIFAELSLHKKMGQLQFIYFNPRLLVPESHRVRSIASSFSLLPVLRL